MSRNYRCDGCPLEIIDALKSSIFALEAFLLRLISVLRTSKLSADSSSTETLLFKQKSRTQQRINQVDLVCIAFAPLLHRFCTVPQLNTELLYLSSSKIILPSAASFTRGATAAPSTLSSCALGSLLSAGFVLAGDPQMDAGFSTEPVSSSDSLSLQI